MSGYSRIDAGRLTLTCAWCPAELPLVDSTEIYSSRFNGWLCSAYGWLCPNCAGAIDAMSKLAFAARGYDEFGRAIRDSDCHLGEGGSIETPTGQ